MTTDQSQHRAKNSPSLLSMAVFCILTLCLCVLLLLSALAGSFSAVDTAKALETEAAQTLKDRVRLLEGDMEDQCRCLKGALAMLAFSVAFAVAFFLHPGSAQGPNPTSETAITRRRIALRVLSVAGIVILAGLALALGAASVLYHIATHMGP